MTPAQRKAHKLQIARRRLSGEAWMRGGSTVKNNRRQYVLGKYAEAFIDNASDANSKRFRRDMRLVKPTYSQARTWLIALMAGIEDRVRHWIDPMDSTAPTQISLSSR
jgi:hypothetical protein